MLGEMRRSPPAKNYEWDSLGKDSKVTRTANELDGEKKLEVAIEEDQILPKYFFSFAELSVWITEKTDEHEVQKMMDVISGAFLNAKDFRRHVKRVEGCARVVAERTHDRLGTKEFQKEKQRRAGDGSDVSAVQYKNNILNVLRKQMLSYAFYSFFVRVEDVPLVRADPSQPSTRRPWKEQLQKNQCGWEKGKFGGTFMTMRYRSYLWY